MKTSLKQVRVMILIDLRLHFQACCTFCLMGWVALCSTHRNEEDERVSFLFNVVLDQFLQNTVLTTRVK